MTAGPRAGGRRPRLRRPGRGGILGPVATCVVVTALLLSAGCTSSWSAGGPDGSDGGSADGNVAAGRSFARDSPWNLPVPALPVLDPGTDAMVSVLTEGGGANALIGQYAVPVFEATATTPRVTVSCTKNWGQCPLEHEAVPVPAAARPSDGTDHAMVVIDRSSGRVYDFWQAEQLSAGAWRVSWGTWAALDGSGVGGDDGGTNGGATGAGVNLLAGLVRLAEVRAGRIDHALAFASSKTCVGTFRYPATKTDGVARTVPCVPEGARLQLDPSIDVARIPGITPGELTVARALQVYGGYVKDTGATPLAVAFEAPTADDDPYPTVARFPWDYYDMPHIPWDHLRVLRRWDGA